MRYSLKHKIYYTRHTVSQVQILHYVEPFYSAVLYRTLEFIPDFTQETV